MSEGTDNQANSTFPKSFFFCVNPLASRDLVAWYAWWSLAMLMALLLVCFSLLSPSLLFSFSNRTLRQAGLSGATSHFGGIATKEEVLSEKSLKGLLASMARDQPCQLSPGLVPNITVPWPGSPHFSVTRRCREPSCHLKWKY